MKCPNCGWENKSSARFCEKCGTELTQTSNTNNNNKIIIALMAAVIILAIGVIFAEGFLNSEVPLETRDFEVFTMAVPAGSEFQEFTSMPSYPNIGGFIFLENVGDYSKEVYMLEVSTTASDSPTEEFSFDHTDEGDVSVYKDHTGQSKLYYATKNIDGYTFALMGEDYKTMVKMINSVEITQEKQEQTTTTTTPTISSDSVTPSISIIGGRFYTGSAEEDKTSAKVNIGREHAGESYIIQIYYSRDGSNLNNGNMVPVTVHPDGSLEVTSADAYHYYPDKAVINIYDTSSNLLTTKTVYLNPTSGTQTF